MNKLIESQIASFSHPIDLSVVVRCGRDWLGLQKCLNSIDANPEIVISVADDASFIGELKKSRHVIAPHSYGNWSLAAQAGIDVASNEHVIIMDADSIFAPGAIGLINNAINDENLIVQPKLVFMKERRFLSSQIAKTREHQNSFKPKAYSPGLGLNVPALVKLIGINGKLYNLSVPYGDDGDLDQRREQAGIPVKVVEDAKIIHGPIDPRHELKTSYRFGLGERLSQPTKTLKNILAEEFFCREAFKYYNRLLFSYGPDALVFQLFCRCLYVKGFIDKTTETKRRQRS